jgi:thymidylate synthase ThyX
MTPASRPILSTHLTDRPDYIVPILVRQDDEALRLYKEAMERAWDGISQLKARGTLEEFTEYLLPNAVAIRFTESADLLSLHHKLAMRLCYNAQEEIWRASLDELLAIRNVNPRIGRHLGPPCDIRFAAGSRPICPEGDRYCGVPAWKLPAEDYRRVI